MPDLSDSIKPTQESHRGWTIVRKVTAAESTITPLPGLLATRLHPDHRTNVSDITVSTTARWGIFTKKARLVGLRMFAEVASAQDTPTIRILAEPTHGPEEVWGKVQVAPGHKQQRVAGSHIFIGDVEFSGRSWTGGHPPMDGMTLETAGNLWYAASNITAATGHCDNLVTMIPTTAATGEEARFSIDVWGDVYLYPYVTAMSNCAAIWFLMREVEH